MSTPRERSWWQEMWEDSAVIRMWDFEMCMPGGAPIFRFPPRRDVDNPDRSWFQIDSLLDRGIWEVMPDDAEVDVDMVRFEEIWQGMSEDERLDWHLNGVMDMSWVRE